eukprot:scaffold10191_cov108-Isochrysis_galbana.AAC.16
MVSWCVVRRLRRPGAGGDMFSLTPRNLREGGKGVWRLKREGEDSRRKAKAEAGKVHSDCKSRLGVL